MTNPNLPPPVDYRTTMEFMLSIAKARDEVNEATADMMDLIVLLLAPLDEKQLLDVMTQMHKAWIEAHASYGEFTKAQGEIDKAQATALERSRKVAEDIIKRAAEKRQ